MSSTGTSEDRTKGSNAYRSYPSQSTPPPRDKFLFIFPLERLADKFCCCCTLKKGVHIMCILEFIVAIFNLLMIIISTGDPMNGFGVLAACWRILGVYPAYLGMLGIFRSIPKYGKAYYRWKSHTFYVLPALSLLAAIVDCSYLNKTYINGERLGECHKWGFIFYLLCFLSWNLYITWIIYSFYTRLMQGEIVLVNHGKWGIDKQRNLILQATALQLAVVSPNTPPQDLELTSDYLQGGSSSEGREGSKSDLLESYQ